MEFPTLVYRCPGDHQRPGGTYSYRSAQDEAQFSAALKDGWFATLPEAMDDKPKEAQAQEAADNAPPTRAELEQKATTLGIKFDGRTNDKKLSAMIEKEMANEKAN